MRNGPWKLVKPYVNRKSNPQDSNVPPVLYDLSGDPAETKDVAAENPKRFERMLDQLNRWSESVEQDRLR